ncbi:MAG: agmatine deiminase family protein [Candidatus Omnitrophica bacterium]|nr:agmatine deiminase family protein [Candidatus Omnitrophota bacterium]
MNLAPIFTKYEKIDMPTKLKSKQTTVSPHALGFYMPAEWQQHAATWLAWPKNPVTWPDRIPQVEEIFLQMIAALAPHETVKLLVDDAKTEDKVLKRLRARGVNLKNVQMHKIVTADAWIRDYGPIFISKGVGVKREIAYTDWMFNAWGGKYKELAKDDAVTLKLRR